MKNIFLLLRGLILLFWGLILLPSCKIANPVIINQTDTVTVKERVTITDTLTIRKLYPQKVFVWSKDTARAETDFTTGMAWANEAGVYIHMQNKPQAPLPTIIINKEAEINNKKIIEKPVYILTKQQQWWINFGKRSLTAWIAMGTLAVITIIMWIRRRKHP